MGSFYGFSFYSSLEALTYGQYLWKMNGYRPLTRAQLQQLLPSLLVSYYCKAALQRSTHWRSQWNETGCFSIVLSCRWVLHVLLWQATFAADFWNYYPHFYHYHQPSRCLVLSLLLSSLRVLASCDQRQIYHHIGLQRPVILGLIGGQYEIAYPIWDLEAVLKKHIIMLAFSINWEMCMCVWQRELHSKCIELESWDKWRSQIQTLLWISSSSSLFKLIYVFANAGFMKNSKYPPNIFRCPSYQNQVEYLAYFHQEHNLGETSKAKLMNLPARPWKCCLQTKAAQNQIPQSNPGGILNSLSPFRWKLAMDMKF